MFEIKESIRLLHAQNPDQNWCNSSKAEAIHIIKNSIPNTLSNLCYYISTTICLSMLSTYSSNDINLLAASGIGSTIIIAAYYSVFYSLNTAVLNLGAQAIGSGNDELMGYTLHRALIINASFMVPLAFLISQGEPFLLLIRVRPEIAALSIKYATDMLPATSFAAIFHTLHYYLVAQEILYPQVISQSLSVTMQYFLCHLLIYCGMDFYKAVILSKLIAEILNLTIIVIYISRRESLALTWFKPKRKSFRKILSQLKTSVEGGAITYFEVLIYEIITFFSGMLESPQVAAQAAFSNFAYIAISPPAGIGNTLAALVSEKLGEGSKKEAIGFIRTGLLVILALTVVGILGIYCFSDEIIHVYTQNPEVMPILKKLLLYYPMFQLFDYQLQATSSLLRSLGLELFALLSYFVVYYFLALPVSYLLGVKYHIGTFGLWIGLALGTTILVLFGLITILCGTNVDKQIVIIQKRLKYLDEEFGTDTTSTMCELKNVSLQKV